MNIADELCRTFCAGVEVHPVPAGLAVGTPLLRPDGDRIGFYLVRGNAGSWRIEDDGFTVPLLIGSGVDIEDGERADQFGHMLETAGAIYDEGELRTGWLTEGAVPDAALKFTTMLLRLCDLAMLHPDRVRKTFKEDALAAIRKTFDGLAEIEENAPISAKLSDFKADAVLRHAGLPPLAIFVGTSDNRIYEAILARNFAKMNNIAVRVAALLESEKPPAISLKVQQRARNYLDASPSFVGDPEGAMGRLLETSGMEAVPSVH
jgi:Domain of unknown function DUF1828